MHVEDRETHTEAREVASLPAGRPYGLPSISWGAIFAGLFVILALSWLIQMLGLAIGVSVADATNSMTLGGTLGTATTVWTIACWLVSFFVGALVTARLAGRIDDVSGMLHGFTVWSVATVVLVVLTYYSVAAFVQTSIMVAGSAVQGVGAAAGAVGQGVSQTASGVAGVTQRITQQYGTQIQDRLYDRAAEIAASSTEGVSEADIRAALDELDARTLRRIVIDLQNQDEDGAAELLAQNTELSQRDAAALIQSAYDSLKQQFGNPENSQSLAQDVKTQLIANIDGYIASFDTSGGPRVTEQDIQQALNQIDAEAAQQIGSQLITGDTQGAKRTIARKTDLTTAQINELVDGATNDINDEITKYQTAVEEAAETVSAYTVAILWLIFGAAAAALAAAIGGGYVGADSSRRLYPHHH